MNERNRQGLVLIVILAFVAFSAYVALVQFMGIYHADHR